MLVRPYTAPVRVDLALLPPDHLPAGRTCVVVDVLRATSTITVLLGRGLSAVYPAASVAEGRALRERLEQVLGRTVGLLGETGALTPPGYDLGNSPHELSRVPLPWREAVLATTNGTPALLACADAPLTLAAAPLNAGAVARAAVEAGRDVLVVCAGTDGIASEDDALAAGLIIARLAQHGAQLTSEAGRAAQDYGQARGDLAAALGATSHGRRLRELGFAHDLAYCAAEDQFEVAGALRAWAEGSMLRPLPGWSAA